MERGWDYPRNRYLYSTTSAESMFEELKLRNKHNNTPTSLNQVYFNDTRRSHNQVYLNHIFEPAQSPDEERYEESYEERYSADDTSVFEESDDGLHDVNVSLAAIGYHGNSSNNEKRRPRKVFFCDEYETSQDDDSIPSCANSLNRRINRKAAERKRIDPKPFELTKAISSRTSQYDEGSFENLNTINYYRKSSLDEGFIEDGSNTTISEPNDQHYPLNCTFDLQLTGRNDKKNSADKTSPKKSVASAIVNQIRRNKRDGSPLLNIARILGKSNDSDDDDLTESETDWKFVQVPEAPRPPIIIPGDQLSAWTPARNCKVSVRAGKVRHMIDYFNQIYDNMHNENPEPVQHPGERQGQILMCPGSYYQSRKIVLKFLEEAKLPTEAELKKKQRPSFWKRVRNAVFRKD